MFAMPFFNFSGDAGSQVINPHFRYYWALAIPLTCCVLAMYGVYVWWKECKYRKEREDGLGEDQRPEEKAVKRQVAPDRLTSSNTPSALRKKSGSSAKTLDPELGMAL